MTEVLAGPACDSCNRIFLEQGRLFVRVDGRWYCVECWRKAGRPWPRREATLDELHAAETATRERMLARGGAHRHLVRKGVS